MANNSMSWSGAMDTRLSPTAAAQKSPTTDHGMTFIGSVSNDIAQVRDDVANLQRAMDCIRADLTAETRARGAELSSFQHKISMELPEQIAKARKEIEGRIDAFEGQTTSWVHTLGQEIHAVKPRMEVLETTIPQHMTSQAMTEGRLAKVEQAIPAVHRSLTSIDERHSSRGVEMESKLGAHRDQHGMEIRAIAANNAAEIKRLEEHLENLRNQELATKTTLGINLQAVEALNEKLSTLQMVLQSKAEGVIAANNAAAVNRLEQQLEILRHQESATKTTLGINLQAVESLNEKVSALQTVVPTKAGTHEVESLEARVSATLEKTVQTMGEELGRKESIATVQGLTDKVNGIAGDVHANARQAQSSLEDLSKKITGVDQGLSKMGMDAASERERCNLCMASLEKDLQTKAVKVDTEAQLQSTKADLEALSAKHTLAAKATNEDVQKIHARALALEENITTKANAADLPRLEMQLAEHHAKHTSHHAVGHEHASRIEQTRSVTDEHRARLEVMEHHQRDIQSQLTQKCEADSHRIAEISNLMTKEYYRREEIDAMMTRVWWRVGDAKQSPKSMLPQLPYAVMR